MKPVKNITMIECYIEDIWGVRFKKASDNTVLPHKHYRFIDPLGNTYIASPRKIPCREQGGSYNLQEYDIYRDEDLCKVDVNKFQDITVEVMLNEDTL